MAGRALVLGGGGITGIAWELGLLAGLAEGGVDLTDADLVIGTSAGSVVAAQLSTGRPLEELYDAQLLGPGQEVAARMSMATVARLAMAALGTRDETRALARIGAMARSAHTMPEQERRAIIASRLPVKAWPDRKLVITAVAADTGEFTTFTAESGVSLVDAVAASCAVPGVWPPSDVNGRLYVDGGVRSPANVDLVAQQPEPYDRVVVIAPISASFRRERGVRAQVAALPDGTRSIVIAPDEAARQAIGRNVLDPARRAGSARAGREQARTLVAPVAAVWRD